MIITFAELYFVAYILNTIDCKSYEIHASKVILILIAIKQI